MKQTMCEDKMERKCSELAQLESDISRARETVQDVLAQTRTLVNIYENGGCPEVANAVEERPRGETRVLEMTYQIEEIKNCLNKIKGLHHDLQAKIE